MVKSGIGCLCLALILCGFLHAQQDSVPSTQQTPPAAAPQANGQPTASQPAQSDAAQQKPQSEKSEEEVRKQEESQRVLGIMPQFSVTSRKDAKPLTPGEKFHLFAKSAFDPYEFGLAGLQAGIDEAEDEFPEYGNGAQGLAKRYAADFGDTVSSGFFSNFFWPVLLKEDPRYFRLGEGTIKHRFVYALGQ